MKNAILTLLILLASAAGATANECKATKFPYARKQSDHDFQKLFEMLDRQALIQYYFDELSAARDVSIAKPLATYLSSTELDKDTRMFFKSLAWAAELDESKSPRLLPLQEICELYAKVKRAN